jgi:hypothetical protein
MEEQTNKQEAIKVAHDLLRRGLITPKTTEEFLVESDKILKWFNN